jgi:hypothetical protein
VQARSSAVELRRLTRRNALQKLTRVATRELRHAVAGGLSLATAVGRYKKLGVRLRSTQREDKMGGSPRFFTLTSSAAIFSSFMLGVLEKSAFAADNQVVFIFGGDVE